MTTDNTELRASFNRGWKSRDKELQAKLAAKDALLDEMAVVLRMVKRNSKKEWFNANTRAECLMTGVLKAKITEALTKYEKEKHK